VKADLQHSFEKGCLQNDNTLNIFQVREVLPSFFTKNGNVSFHEPENLILYKVFFFKVFRGCLDFFWKVFRGLRKLFHGPQKDSGPQFENHCVRLDENQSQDIKSIKPMISSLIFIKESIILSKSN